MNDDAAFWARFEAVNETRLNGTVKPGFADGER